MDMKVYKVVVIFTTSIIEVTWEAAAACFASIAMVFVISYISHVQYIIKREEHFH